MSALCAGELRLLKKIISEYGHVRENEIRFVLDNLNKSRTYCDCGWLNHNGMVVQEGLASNIFQPLSLAFGGSPDNMAESICNELSKVNYCSGVEVPYEKINLICLDKLGFVPTN